MYPVWYLIWLILLSSEVAPNNFNSAASVHPICSIGHTSHLINKSTVICIQSLLTKLWKRICSYLWSRPTRTKIYFILLWYYTRCLKVPPSSTEFIHTFLCKLQVRDACYIYSLSYMLIRKTYLQFYFLRYNSPFLHFAKCPFHRCVQHLLVFTNY
jgi:hypothetical protein